MNHNKSNSKVVFIISILFCILFFFGLVGRGHNWGDDFAQYILQAQAIIDGSIDNFYIENKFTIEKSSWAIGLVTYPWGFPILLAPIYYFFGMSLWSFKILVLSCYLIFCFVLAIGYKRFLSGRELFAFYALFSFNCFMLSFADNVLSDIPFLLFSTLSIVLISTRSLIDSRLILTLNSVALAFSIFFSSAIRLNGIVLILMLLIFQFRSYIAARKKAVVRSNIWIELLPYTIFIVLMLLYYLLLPINNQAGFTLLDRDLSFNSLFFNFKYNFLILGDFFGRSVLGFAIYLITIPFFVIGVMRYWRVFFIEILYFFIIYVLMVVWPHQQGLRYLFPVLPFYVIFMILGLRNFEFKTKYAILNQGYFLNVIIAIFIVQCSFYSIKYYFLDSKQLNYSDHDNVYGPLSSQMFSYIGQYAGSQDVIVFRKPRAMRLITGHSSLMYDKIADYKSFDFVVIDKIIKDNQIEISQLPALIEQYHLEKIFENEQFLIFRR